MNKREAAKVAVGDVLFHNSNIGSTRYRVVDIHRISDDLRDKLPLFKMETGELITYLLLERGEQDVTKT